MSGELIVAIVAASIAGVALIVAGITAVFARSQTASAKASAEAAEAQVRTAEDQVAVARRAADSAHEQVEVAQEQVRAAREQTELQDTIRKDQAQPYVVVDIRGDPAQGHLWQVSVSNLGATIARDITVTFFPPLQKRLGPERSPFSELDRGITFLPPGQSMVWHLGTSFSYFEGDQKPGTTTVTINCTGPFGPLDPLAYDISLDELGSQAVNERGSMAKITDAIEKVSKSLGTR